MRRSEFIKLYETQKERVAADGKRSPEWFLGFVEGFRKQKLTGYQVGALIHLLLIPDPPVPEPKQTEKEKEVVSGEKNTFSIPGIL